MAKQFFYILLYMFCFLQWCTIIRSTNTEKYKDFRRASLVGIHPSFGPVDGGTLAILLGENLDVGKQLQIWIGHANCAVEQRSADYIICRTTPLASISENSKQPITLELDGLNFTLNGNLTFNRSGFEVFENVTWNGKLSTSVNGAYVDNMRNQSILEFGTNFEYRLSPELTKIHGQLLNSSADTNKTLHIRTIAQGGTELIFEGRHLDSAKYPFFEVNLDTSNSKLCSVNNSTMITCLIPPSPYEIFNNTVNAYFSLHLDQYTFSSNDNDQLNSAISYHPIPTFNKFKNITEIVYSVVKPTGWIVDLHGNNLNPYLPYRIMLNDYPCMIILPDQMNFTYLRCRVATGSAHHEDLWDKKMNLTIQIGQTIDEILGEVVFRPRPSPKSAWSVSLVIGGVVLVITGAAAVIIYRFKKKTYTKVALPKKLDEYFMEAYDNLDLYNELKNLSFMIDENNCQYKIGKQIGDGGFGKVYECKYNNRDVAFKTLKKLDDIEFKFQLQAFFMEADRMKEFYHENVLSLIGIVVLEEYPAILMPLMNKGDLHTYVQNKSNVITVRKLFDFAIQIADGMKYLASKKFLHGDLAARNCLLHEIQIGGNLDIYNIKIADFGLARRFLVDKYYYRANLEERKLPYRWMPMEVLAGDNKMTTKTDVWSFGVLLWELFTRGLLPYEEIAGDQLDSHLSEGNRLPKPGYCPDIVYSIMMACWVNDPHNRPTFAELINQLQQILELIDHKELKETSFITMTENSSNNFVRCPLNFNEASIKMQINDMYAASYNKAFQKLVNQE